MRVQRWASRLFAVAVVLWGGFGGSPAFAQDAGFQLGVSGDPNQFYLGGHVETEPLYEELRFRPNVEVGFGDDETLVALNLEFIYPIELRSGPSVYVGAGPAINIADRRRPTDDDTSVEPGFNFLGGMSFMEGYFAEIKVGVIDSPEFKFGVGYTFR